jgi:hypothetical protein
VHKGKRKRYERTRRASNWGSENDGIASKYKASWRGAEAAAEESGEDKGQVKSSRSRRRRLGFARETLPLDSLRKHALTLLHLLTSD